MEFEREEVTDNRLAAMKARRPPVRDQMSSHMKKKNKKRPMVSVDITDPAFADAEEIGQNNSVEEEKNQELGDPKEIDVTGSMLNLMKAGLISAEEFEEMMAVLGDGDENVSCEIVNWQQNYSYLYFAQLELGITAGPLEPPPPPPHRPSYANFYGYDKPEGGHAGIDEGIGPAFFNDPFLEDVEVWKHCAKLKPCF